MTIIRRLLLGGLAIVPTCLWAQDATVIEHTVEVECHDYKSATCKERLVVRINNDKGAHMGLFMNGCSSNSDLSKFSGQVTGADGSVLKKIKKSDLTHSEYSQSLADDSHFYYYDYKPSNYPVTLTYEWENVFSKRLMSFPRMAPQTDYEVNVEKASYRLTATPENQVRWHAVNCNPDVKTTTVGNKTIYEVEMHDLPAIKKYSYALPIDQLVPMIYWEPESFKIEDTRCDLTSWQKLGEWTWTLCQGRNILPEVLKEKLHQLTDTCTSDRSKVEVVRRMMGETTRYVSIQLGIGGWQPMSASDVFQKGLGDCKALSNYLCSMLDEVGVKAVYTLISTSHESLLPDFASMNQLDHVVVMVPLQQDTMWIECTNPRVPTGYAPRMWAGHEALMVTEQGGEIIRVPVLPLDQHSEVAAYDIVIDADGDASVTCHSVSRGRCYESDAPLEWASEKDQKSSIAKSLHLPRISISQLEVKSEGPKLTLDLEAQSESYARVSGQRMFIPVSPFQFESMRNAKEPAHVIDMKDAGYLHRDTVRFTLPEGWEVESLPKPKNDVTEYGTNQLTVTADGRMVTLVVACQINSGIYPQEKYNGWIAFLKGRTQLTKGEIVVRKKE